MNENAARMLDFDEPNMLLGESNQAFSNAKTPFLCSRTRAMESILLELIRSSLMNGVPSKIWLRRRVRVRAGVPSPADHLAHAWKPSHRGVIWTPLASYRLLSRHSQALANSHDGTRHDYARPPNRLPRLRTRASFQKKEGLFGPVTQKCSRPRGK